MALSLHHGQRVILDQVGGFADGVAVKEVGEETFRLCQELIDGVVLVSRDAICASIKVRVLLCFKACICVGLLLGTAFSTCMVRCRYETWRKLVLCIMCTMLKLTMLGKPLYVRQKVLKRIKRTIRF